MEADTHDLLAESIRALLAEGPANVVTGLAELGWAEVVAADEVTAWGLLFREQGRAGVSTGALDAVMLDAFGVDAAAGAVAVVHPLGRSSSAVAADRLRLDGVALSGGTVIRTLAVAAPDDRAAVYLVSAPEDAVKPVSGFDAGPGLHRVLLDVDLDDVERRETPAGAADSAAHRALSDELIGCGEAMLEVAVDQIGQRRQFGRPIGSNQSPRHSMADAYVALSGARALVGTAWVSRDHWDAVVAKAYAGQAAELTARACMQVCGAIGLTAEHALGTFVKRARILDALYGGWQQKVNVIGRSLLAERTLPSRIGA